MITLYGIPNCDTVKRSRAWFADHGIAYTFHDFKSKGVPAAELDRWLETLGWEALVNKKGTTWRKLSPAVQAAVTDAKSARALMLRESSVIKRPVVAADGELTVGFTPDAWAHLAKRD
ncbi:MAG TPA: ArsC family reductase [Polyangiaceae bacterium]|jgi:Spx/MgsR family transcriptional regulator|nr:ArsC family reductase [Polyangiaceae bacterium]